MRVRERAHERARARERAREGVEACGAKTPVTDTPVPTHPPRTQREFISNAFSCLFSYLVFSCLISYLVSLSLPPSLSLSLSLFLSLALALALSLTRSRSLFRFLGSLSLSLSASLSLPLSLSHLALCRTIDSESRLRQSHYFTKPKPSTKPTPPHAGRLIVTLDSGKVINVRAYSVLLANADESRECVCETDRDSDRVGKREKGRD